MPLSTADHAKIHNAIETAAAIMREKAVIEQAGYAYVTEEVEAIQRGVEAFHKLDLLTSTHAARFQNEGRLALVGKAMDVADILLAREGFQTLKGQAWTDHDQAVIKEGLGAFERATAYQRG